MNGIVSFVKVDWRDSKGETMRILVYGAGILGSNLASNLCKAKKDVTILARGKWAENIKKNGLKVKTKWDSGLRPAECL